MKDITKYIYEGLFDRFKKKINAPDQKIQPKENPVEYPKKEKDSEEKQDEKTSKEEVSTKSNENTMDVCYSNIDGFTKEEFDKCPTFDTKIAGISNYINPTFSFTWGVVYHDRFNDYDSNAWVIMDQDKTKIGYIPKAEKKKFLSWAKGHKRIPYIGLSYKWVCFDNDYYEPEIKCAGWIVCLRSHEEENGKEEFNKLLLKEFNSIQSFGKRKLEEFKKDVEKI